MTAASDRDQPCPRSAQAHVGRQRLGNEILQGSSHGVVGFQGGLVPRRQRIPQVDELRHGRRDVAVAFTHCCGPVQVRRGVGGMARSLSTWSLPRWCLWQESDSRRRTQPALAPTCPG